MDSNLPLDSITPELVARLASKIYNERPTESGVESPVSPMHAPPTPSPLSHVPTSTVPSVPAPAIPGTSIPGMSPQSPVTHVPSFDALSAIAPSAHALPLHASPTHMPAHMPAHMPTTPVPLSFGLHAPDQAGAVATRPSSLLDTATSHDVHSVGRANGPSSPASSAGLRAFVQQVRTSHFADPIPWARLKSHDVQSSRDSRASRLEAPASSMTPSGHFQSSPSGSGDSLDAVAIRRDFPILQQRVNGHPLAWFDNAATTQKPQSVIDAISQFYRNDNSNIHRGAHTLAARATDAYEHARERVRVFLGAQSAKEIVFVRGTTEAVNLAAQTYGRKFLRADDEIVLSHLEHHANIVPWQMIARETGARLRVIPVNDRGEVLLDEYRRILSTRTKIVALTQASNSLGTILPVAEMTAMAKAFGARVLVDGAQSVAHLPVRVSQLGCDFFAFSGHKIFGPTGIGVLYVREELHEILPPWQGGGNMIRNVTFEETTYSDAPAKFEAGTPNIADAVGLHAALDYVSHLGLDRIAAYEHSLLEYATSLLARIQGIRMIGAAPEKVALISFVLDQVPNEEVGKALDRAGIAVRVGHHCAQPSLRRFGLEATIRPSFSIYNTREEIDRMVSVLRGL